MKNSKQQLLKEIVSKGSITRQDALKELSPSEFNGLNNLLFFYKIGDLYYGEGSKMKHRKPGETPEQTTERWMQNHEGKTREQLQQLSTQGYKVRIIRAASERNQVDADRG